MAGPWLDGYIVSTYAVEGDMDAVYGRNGLYDQPGVAFRKRTEEVTYTEDLYTGDGDPEPTSGPSLVASRIDPTEPRTLKLVFNTPVTRGPGAITVPGHSMGGVRVVGRIAYITLSKSISLPSVATPVVTVTVTLAANAFRCWVDAQQAYLGNAGATQTITFGATWVIDTTQTTKPAWAVCWAYFKKLVPPSVTQLGMDTGGTVPPMPADPGSISARWYVTNGATEAAIDSVFIGTITAGGDSLRVTCKLKADSVESLKPYGTAVITALHEFTEDEPYSVECTAVDTCATSGGGGGGDTSVAIVLGGNSPQVVAPFDASKPYIYALNRFPTPTDPAKPADWTKLDLPLTFKHGDDIPVAPNTNTHAWPKGVGLARLARGSPNVGGSAWNADLDPVDPLANVAARPHHFLTKRGTDSTKVYCYFDKSSITAADHTKITMNLGYTVTGAAVSGPVLTLTVSPALTAPDVAAGLAVTFLSKALVVCTDASTGNNVYLNPQTVNVSPIDDDSPVAVDDVAIRGAVIEPSALNKIKVWMSGPVSAAASTAGWALTGGSPALSLTAAAVTDATNGILSLTLNRSITAADLSGAIELSHTAAITTQTAVQTASPANIPSSACAAGGPVGVIYKAARGCYVLVINRYTETDYTENDLIDVSGTSFVDLADLNNVTRRCYDSRLREGARTTTIYSAWITLLVKGGNTLNASSPLVKGIKRVAGEAVAVGWIYTPRTATAIAGVSAGAVSAITATDAGQGYISAPTVTIAPPPSGTQATATATLTAANGGSVLAVKITACGSGYWDQPTVAFSAPGGGGTTATGTVITRLGKIVGVTITNPGSNYTSAPTITFTPGAGGGAGAAASPIMQKGSVLSITITNPGSGYTAAPSVTIDAPTATEPDPSTMADGIGWCSVLAAYQSSGISAGDLVLVVNDQRSAIMFPLVASGVDGGVTIQGSDAVISWAETKLRLTGMDMDANGILPAWVPMGGGV